MSRIIDITGTYLRFVSSALIVFYNVLMNRNTEHVNSFRLYTIHIDFTTESIKKETYLMM